MKAIKKPIEVEVWRIGDLAHIPEWVRIEVDDGGWLVSTLEGDMRASTGDYLIRGVLGELYPCKKEIFEETYEIVG